VSPVKYELGSYIPEDDILHKSGCRFVLYTRSLQTQSVLNLASSRSSAPTDTALATNVGGNPGFLV
jgi:hypothetical protein